MLMLAVTLPELLVPNKSGARCSITHCLATACTVLLSALPLPWFCLCQPLLSKIITWYHLGDRTEQQQFPLHNMDTTVPGEVVCSQQHSSRLCTQAVQSTSFFTQSTAVTQCVVCFELNKRHGTLSVFQTAEALWEIKETRKSADAARVCHFTRETGNAPCPCFIVLSYLGTGTLIVGSKQLTSSCVTEKSKACNF